RGVREAWLQRHAALRARSRLRRANVGVHRTDEGRSRCRRRRNGGGRLQELLRIVLETLQTTRVAEVVRHAVVLMCADRIRLVDRHAADGINLTRVHSSKRSGRSEGRVRLQPDKRGPGTSPGLFWVETGFVSLS